MEKYQKGIKKNGDFRKKFTKGRSRKKRRNSRGKDKKQNESNIEDENWRKYYLKIYRRGIEKLR